jgi:hemolysin activation/secretion protein
MVYLKKIFIAGLFTFSTLYGVEIPAQAPQKAGEFLDSLEKLKKEDDKLKKPKKPASIENLEVADEAKGQGESKLEGPTFVLQNVSISGNTIFDQQIIIDIIKPYVGQKVSSATLKHISNELTKLYIDAGYATSKCIIPAQKVENGNVKFQIIEDRLGRIILSGERSYNYNPRVFNKYLQELQGKAINVNTLNEKLQLLSKLPVTKIKPKLQKNSYGGTDLLLEIIDNIDKSSISTDNSGSEYTGKYRVYLQSSFYNIRGESDLLNLSINTSSKTKHFSSLAASYVHPLGINGGRISFVASTMNYMLDPDEVGTDLIIYEGSSSSYGLSYSRPFILKENKDLSISAGLEKRTTVSNTIQNSNGEVLIDGKDENFVVNLGFSFGLLDQLAGEKYKGYNSFSFNFQRGIEGFMDTMTDEDLKRKEDDITFPISGPIKYGDNLKPDFKKFILSLSRQQQLPYKIVGNLSASGEYTKYRVPDAYEYGGGDYGYGTSASISRVLSELLSGLSGSISYSQSYVYTYDLDLSKDLSKGKSIGYSLSYSKYDAFASLSYSSDPDDWEHNEDNIRFKIGYNW